MTEAKTLNVPTGIVLMWTGCLLGILTKTMKRQFCLLLLVNLFGLVSDGLVHAEPIRPPDVVQLGTAHGRSIFCRISLIDLGGGGEDAVRLAFQARDRAGRLRRFQVGAGDCFGDDPTTLHITVGDYVRLGRRQVLVSASYGRTTSFLYDCDGNSIRTLYARDEGRVSVWFERGSGRHWRLVEQWRYDQYRDDEDSDLGTAVIVTAPARDAMGTVQRKLHWNGRRFIPDRPGPTRIVE